MHAMPDDVFEQFIRQRKKDLMRIARHTRGEHQFEDVVNEAWLMAWRMRTEGAKEPDLSQAAGQQLLLSHLYQHLVRYTELNVRHAVRLDHAPAGSGADGDIHPLAYLLVSDDGHDPLSKLVVYEGESTLERQLENHGSLAAAYVRLLRYFDHNMIAVAEHLRVSSSYAYRRCAHAMRQATQLAHIPIPLPSETFVPGPWRGFRLRHAQIQLAFNFDDELPL